ncbi:MAG: hypothetical protein QOJ12_1409, partial [Thermoleophilales bacterium]|nr:hypothetical protein [Thermoleophilales bacterium]
MSFAEALLRHAALALAVCALAGFGLRVAAWAGARGLLALVVAAPVAAGTAVLSGLLLGALALGGSAVALVAVSVAVWAAARRRLPPSGALAALGAWWARLEPVERALAGGLAGAWAAWTAWLVLHPAFGHDMVLYHLPEAALWVQQGTPGSVEQVVTGLPVGNYPLTHEVLLSWGMAIGHSFVWATLVTAAMPALAALAAYAGLRSLGVDRLVAGLASVALIATPAVLASQSGGASLDPAALAWLCCCGALCAGARREPRLVVPAVVAGGLAIGTKTTAAALTLVVLGVTLWFLRARVRPMVVPLGVAVLAALGIGGYWYARNLVDHGSPLWPFVQGPFGDPRPPLIANADVSFADRPGDTLDRLATYYRGHFGGPLLLLAGALVAPLLVRCRAVAFAALAVAGSIVLWLEAPFTGVVGNRIYDAGTGDATRYLLPGVAAAVLTLALASRGGRSRVRVAVSAVLAVAAVVGLRNTFGLGYPAAPSVLTPLAGVAVGAVLAVAAGRVRAPAWAA